MSLVNAYLQIDKKSISFMINKHLKFTQVTFKNWTSDRFNYKQLTFKTTQMIDSFLEKINSKHRGYKAEFIKLFW